MFNFSQKPWLIPFGKDRFFDHLQTYIFLVQNGLLTIKYIIKHFSTPNMFKKEQFQNFQFLTETVRKFQFFHH